MTKNTKAILAFWILAAALPVLAAGLPPQYANTPTAKDYPKADVLVLSETRSFTLAPDGRVTEKVRRVEKILTYIANTNVKTLGWLGVITLLATVFSMVGTVEKAFNTIWGVRRGRTAWRKFTDFLGDDRNTLSGLAGARCFHTGVKSEQIGLERDLVNDANDVADLGG